jgi:hypothetical protein
MLKLLMWGGIAVFLFVLTAVRKAKGRKDVELLESGKMCIHCHGTNVTPGAVGVVCNTCGQTTSWKLIKHPKLSATEMDDISDRD